MSDGIGIDTIWLRGLRKGGGLLAFYLSLAVLPGATWAQTGFTTPFQVTAGAPILNEFGQIIQGDSSVPLSERPLVQILELGGEILPPQANGDPQNALLEGGETSIGTLVAPVLVNSGLFGASIAQPRPSESLQVFVRVYNNTTTSNSLFYADSTNTMAVSGNTPFIAYMGPMTNILHPGRDTDGDGMPDWWEHLNFAGDPTGGNASEDYDGDGQAALNEYIAGTDPFDAASTFAITSIEALPSGEILAWSSVSARKYRVEYSTNLVFGEYFTLPGAGDLDATPPVNTFTNTFLPESAPVYYRARVRLAD